MKQGVRVEIITLPYDSLNSDVRIKVTALFENLISGLRTDSISVSGMLATPKEHPLQPGRWYSFHGKFIVTDKAAISLSGKFHQQKRF